jgi:hypothetical protein
MGRRDPARHARPDRHADLHWHRLLRLHPLARIGSSSSSSTYT